MIFVKFKIQYGDCEYFDYSRFKSYDLADYGNDEFITDKDIIREVYGEGCDEEIFEDNFDEDTNKYEDCNGDFISVHSVQEMTEKELDVLSKLGVLYR